MNLRQEAKLGITFHRSRHTRPRNWDTQVGTTPLNITMLREGNYMTRFIEPRRTSELAFAPAIQGVYFNGVSTRSADMLIRAINEIGFSKI